MIGLAVRLLMTPALSTPTTSVPMRAVPTEAARLLAVPRSAPTSPASSLGDEVTSTLKSSVTSAPWPMPKATRPSRTGKVLQLLLTTKASHNAPAATSVKA